MLSWMLSAVGGIGVALALRGLYQPRRSRSIVNPFTVGHIVGLPFAAGFVGTVAGAPAPLPALALGGMVTLGYGTILLALRWQRALSVLLHAPIFLGSSFLGAIAASAWLAGSPGRVALAVVAGVVAGLPLVVSWGETRWPARRQRIKVRSRTIVAASPEVIWDRIVRVESIRPHEWGAYRLFALLGFPAPQRAELDIDGPGGTRLGIFSNRVLFEEPVAVWRPGRRVAFDIRVNPDAIAALPFDDFTRIGGEYFGLDRAEYVLEPLSDGCVCLHLNSVQWVQTRWNRYAGWWGRLILGAFQRNILTLVKQRCEAAATAANGSPALSSARW